ncbi:MAG TPA: protein-glutamate O-methyltransferase CheR, partial [Methylophaga aminisulfidivorans]|nr:protein-glutamate O-methyltransferase CheR [Methylophaga aminisulfidivorans]
MEAFSVEHEFDFTDKHFAKIRAFVTAHTGIVLPDTKKDMVYGRLSKHIRQRHQGSFDSFCEAIDNADAEEQDCLINAITTNLTAFFREKHHFDFLKNTVLPELLIKNKQTKRIRIWSAGCSTGEEPYSIAICLYDFFRDKPDWDVKVLASDLDANVVKQGESAVYEAIRVKSLSENELKSWFERGTGKNDG